jgi:gas vesicle protein
MREEENRQRSEFKATDKLTYLLIGGGIGALVALLLAPKSGTELRDDIADVTRKGVDKGRETAAQIGGRAGEYYEVARERAGRKGSRRDGTSEKHAFSRRRSRKAGVLRRKT